MEYTVKTRKQAFIDGDARYFTGVPCSRGHDSARSVNSGVCCACNRENANAYRRGREKQSDGRLRGAFFYPLHPDDHAKAQAFCQALDLDRGRAPYIPPVKQALEGMTPEEATEAARKIHAGKGSGW